jgi:hypothetical protein
MTADEYRRRGFEAQRQAARATDRLAKADFELLAQEWLALAERTEWLEQRYSLMCSDSSHAESSVVQQQIQSEDEN